MRTIIPQTRRNRRRSIERYRIVFASECRAERQAVMLARAVGEDGLEVSAAHPAAVDVEAADGPDGKGVKRPTTGLRPDSFYPFCIPSVLSGNCD